MKERLVIIILVINLMLQDIINILYSTNTTIVILNLIALVLSIILAMISIKKSN